MPTTTWQESSVAHQFLDERRKAMPYAADQIEMMLQLVRAFRPNPRRIADLGCGDGILARMLLSVYPGAHAVLVDHSLPMLARAREAMAEVADRCEIVQADLAEPLNDVISAGTMDIIVSGYAIHHLTDEKKRSLYQSIYEALKPGGLFVNIEHVSSSTPEIEAMWDDIFIDSMHAHSEKTRETIADEYHRRPDKADNILSPVEQQVEWLREIGFIHADCYFKFLELAVFGGVKPIGG